MPCETANCALDDEPRDPLPELPRTRKHRAEDALFTDVSPATAAQLRPNAQARASTQADAQLPRPPQVSQHEAERRPLLHAR